MVWQLSQRPGVSRQLILYKARSWQKVGSARCSAQCSEMRQTNGGCKGVSPKLSKRIFYLDVSWQLVLDGERHEGAPVCGHAVGRRDACIVERIRYAGRKSQERLDNNLRHVNTTGYFDT